MKMMEHGDKKPAASSKRKILNMSSLITIGMATAAGVTSRILALGLTGRKATDGIQWSSKLL